MISPWLEEPLKNFDGAIITDEHEPYQRLANENLGVIVNGGCCAHAHNKLVGAIEGRRHTSEVHQLVEQIAHIYKLGQKIFNLNGIRN